MIAEYGTVAIIGALLSSQPTFYCGTYLMSRTEALEEAIRRTRTRLEYYCNEANAGRMPSDAREFMRRVQCGFDSLFEEAAALEQGVDATLKQFDAGLCDDGSGVECAVRRS